MSSSVRTAVGRSETTTGVSTSSASADMLADSLILTHTLKSSTNLVPFVNDALYKERGISLIER